MKSIMQFDSASHEAFVIRNGVNFKAHGLLVPFLFGISIDFTVKRALGSSYLHTR